MSITWRGQTLWPHAQSHYVKGVNAIFQQWFVISEITKNIQRSKIPIQNQGPNRGPMVFEKFLSSALIHDI
jgi:hypothetical protein